MSGLPGLPSFQWRRARIAGPSLADAWMLPRQGLASRRPGTVSWLGVHYSTNEAFLFPGNPSAVARWAMADKHGRTILRDSAPGTPTTMLGIAFDVPDEASSKTGPGVGSLFAPDATSR